MFEFMRAKYSTFVLLWEGVYTVGQDRGHFQHCAGRAQLALNPPTDAPVKTLSVFPIHQ